MRSRIWNDLLNSMLKELKPGPRTTPLAEVPNCPGAGAVSAAGLNHLFTERESPGRFGFAMASGRIVTFAGVLLLVYAVPVGSGPVHSGVRFWPLWAL